MRSVNVGDIWSKQFHLPISGDVRYYYLILEKKEVFFHVHKYKENRTVLHDISEADGWRFEA